MKKTLALILSALMLLPLAACSYEKEEDRLNIQPSYRETENDNDESFDFGGIFGSDGEEDEEQTEAETEAAPTTYENKYIKIYGHGDQHKGNIAEIYGSDAWILRTKDGKLYNAPYTKEDHQRAYPDVEVLKTYVRGNNSIYECANGYTYINWTPCRDIKGEILCTIGGVNVISYDDGKLYYTCFAETGSLVTPSEEMALYEYSKYEKVEGRIDYVEVRLHEMNLYFLIGVGDRTFFGYVFMIQSEFRGSRYISLYELKPEYDKILDFGYKDSCASPLYSKSDDATTLNYTVGMYGEDEYAVNLPEGYTAADVKQAIFGDDILVQFNDGTVYTAYLFTNVAGTNLSLDEPLTEISKAGHVNKFYIRDGNVLMHCDDDVIYCYEL